ncbi:asparagine synthase (glutamine-hydrolyzing) [Aurantivibrio infirmus]
MCGITGIVDFNFKISKSNLEKATSSIASRGPDDFGYFIDADIGLGHRRLSIIDLTDSGKQPMQSSCGRYVLVYNGEIYNFCDIREDLVKQGCRFKGKSDSEVVLNALIHYGIDAISKFNGMFAFAFWDNFKKKLYLGRDRFGIKPLYYASVDGSLVFGSEIKAINKFEKSRLDLNINSLSEFMWFGNALGENTFYNGIVKLRPGHHLLFDKSGLQIQKYWAIENVPVNPVPLDQAISQVSNLFASSIKSHLIADVPVSVFLSGGIDSSAITAYASEYYEGVLDTYSVGFDFHKGGNEFENARLVSKMFGTNHHEIEIGANNLADDLTVLSIYHDEPFSDAANIPLYLLTKQLKGDQKVVLQGDGGDEIFAGYRRYNLLSHHFFWMMLSKIGLEFSFLYRKTKYFERVYRILNALSQRDPALRMAFLLTFESPHNLPTDVLSQNVKNKLANYDPFSEYRFADGIFSHLDTVEKMLRTDCTILLPNTYLEKVDKSTMANSIEVRVPFLDKDLSEFVIGLPSNYKVRNSQKKWLLRKSLRGVVPDSILDAKKKGFGVPFSAWLRKPLADFMKETINSEEVRSAGVFQSDLVNKKICEHCSGMRNHGAILWKVLVLGIWIKANKVRV